MGKVSSDGQKLLPKLQKFLLERKLVPEKMCPTLLTGSACFSPPLKDIDFHASTILVRSGKGDNDRSTVLPRVVKDRHNRKDSGQSGMTTDTKIACG